MAPSDNGHSGASCDYLCVDAFITDLVTARALSSAFELQLIDLLQHAGSAGFDALCSQLPATANGLRLLLRLLQDNDVVEKDGEAYRLSERFSAALRYRDLLEAKLDFAHIAAHDVIDLFSQLLVDPQEFMKRAAMFRLFNYGNAQVVSPESRALTARWMRLTTMLTRYEAAPCLERYDFGRHRRMLDVGGNSGEFALQACRANPSLTATVFDLPVVCALGRDHLLQEAEAARIDFRSGNIRTGALPAGYDLITFKSMLHDWPDSEAQSFLHKACCALEPGGTLLIYERGELDFDHIPMTYSLLPILLFAHTLRSPELYLKTLAACGLSRIRVQWLELDVPFFIITAVKEKSESDCTQLLAKGDAGHVHYSS